MLVFKYFVCTTLGPEEEIASLRNPFHPNNIRETLKMNQEETRNTVLLEEVFKEVESTEISKESNRTKPEFLEELINLDKQILSKNRNSFKGKSGSTENLEGHGSAVHEGLTDSSDDEENKYFEESKYNECGKNINNLIKQNTTRKPKFSAKSKAEGAWRKEKSGTEDLKEQLEKFSNAGNEKGYFIDPILGMRIINPLLSSVSLKEKLVGRISVSTLKLKKFLESPTHKDSNWITGGAIIRKYLKTSRNGNQYCVWHLTDLAGDIKSICVFLFGSAYIEYWKTSLGAVVGILNPTVMNSNEKSEATLRVDNAQKILLMGTSRDYGLCKSKKKSGENCSSVVNKSKSDYCVYHIKKEYNKACRRPDLQPPKMGRSLDNLRAKVLGKSPVFYGGKAFTGVMGKKSVKQTVRDEKTIRLLSQKNAKSSNDSREQKESILKMLGRNPEPAKDKDISASSKSEPQLVDLEFTISKKERNAAKANALRYIREHGPLRKQSEKTKRTEEQISSLKRKLGAEEKGEAKKAKLHDTQADPAKRKYLDNGITNEFLRLMNSETRNTEILKMAESNEREKYFEKLETREKMEAKMASTFKIECKAVRCLKCNYKSFSASDLCKKEKHPLKVVNAIKRFWKCKNCSGRTVCLELIPLHSCKVCGSSKWEKTSMMPEKKDSNLMIEKLSLRGDEEKYVGAVVNQASLSLLVPEEAL